MNGNIPEITIPALPNYVLITPARDEAQFIEDTIASMIAQTALPLTWVIVSDGSTDGTEEIVNKYRESYPWIDLVRMPLRQERNFAGKVEAFNAGYARLAGFDYEVIGNLDADVSFNSDYLAQLLGKFAENPQLGVAGTPYREYNCMGKPCITYDYRFASSEDVPGACQLFRRRCFEQIGGYRAIRGGNVDSVAVVCARTKGWQTRVFVDSSFLHHRPSGTAQAGSVGVNYKKGVKAASMGSHPLWVLFRAAYHMFRRPYLIGGLALLFGYVRECLRGSGREIPSEVVAFQRKEQLQRLNNLLFNPRILLGLHCGRDEKHESDCVS